MSSTLVADLVSRRGALGRLGGLALAATGLGACGTPAASRNTSASASTSTSALDLADPRDNLYAFGKVWSSYGAPVIGGYHGIQYARIGNRRLIPLFGYVGTGATVARFDPVRNELHLKSRETSFFTDLRTGDILESWKNPFTGETVPVYHFYDWALAGVLGTTMPAIEMTKGDPPTLVNEGTVFPDANGARPFRMPFERSGPDDVLLAWDYTHDYTNPVDPQGWPRASVGPRITPSEHFLFHLPRRALEDRDVPTVRFVAGFMRQSNWWPWMKMGAIDDREIRDGLLVGRMFSHKGLPGTGDVPPKVLAYLERHAPEYLEVPPDWTPRADRIDTQKAYVQDVPPEVAGYAWTQKRKADVPGPPTGAGARG